MSVTASERVQQHFETPNGDEALMIIDMHRDAVGDQTRLQELDEEFPFLETQLGQRAFVLDLTENQAGTFKWRGAMYATHRSVTEYHTPSVWTNSAGNHARGIVLAARTYDVPADIRMPKTVSPKKQTAAEELWPGGNAHTTLAGRDFNETVAYSAKNPGAGTYIHPFDNHSVMHGQGTIADDLLRIRPDVTDIVLPIGGGGLVGGVAHRLTELQRDDITLHAVTVEGSDSLPLSIQHAAGGAEVTSATNPNRRFEGSCVSAVSSRAVELCMQYPNLQLHSVSTQEVDATITEYEQHRRDNWLESVDPYEPTTMIAVAGLSVVRGDRVVVLGTGRNAPLTASSPTPSRLHVFNGPQVSFGH